MLCRLIAVFIVANYLSTPLYAAALPAGTSEAASEMTINIPVMTGEDLMMGIADELTEEDIAALDAEMFLLEDLAIPIDDSLSMKAKVAFAVFKDLAGAHWQEHKGKYIGTAIGVAIVYVVYRYKNRPATES